MHGIGPGLSPRLMTALSWADCQTLSTTSVSLPQMVTLFREAAWERRGAESSGAGPKGTCPLRPPPPESWLGKGR